MRMIVEFVSYGADFTNITFRDYREVSRKLIMTVKKLTDFFFYNFTNDFKISDRNNKDNPDGQGYRQSWANRCSNMGLFWGNRS